MSLTNATIKHQLVSNRFVAIEDRLQHLKQYTHLSLARLKTNTVALQTHITNNKRKGKKSINHEKGYVSNVMKIALINHTYCINATHW